MRSAKSLSKREDKSHRRVLFLTQYFPPETGAPQARLYELAVCLIARGWTVEVLTALPSYPTGRTYDGYRRRVSLVEDMDGIRVVRTPLFPTKSASTILRLTNYLSFVASSVVLGAWRVGRPRVIVCESPPLFLGLAAAFLKRLFRCRLVFNVSDLWPDSALNLGLYREGLAVRMARRLELFCYTNADLVTGQSPEIAQELALRHPKGRASLLPNGCDCDLFRPHVDVDPASSDEALDALVLGYAGLLGVAQGVGILLDVGEMLKHERVQIRIAGEGPERQMIETELKRRRLTNVSFIGHIPREKMPEVVSSFDLAFIPLRYRIPGAVPSKLYEAMACGVPVLFAADGDGRDLVERADSGIIVQYDAGSIATGVRRLLDDPAERSRLGQNGRSFVLKNHHRPIIGDKLDRLLTSLVDGDDVLFQKELTTRWS